MKNKTLLFGLLAGGILVAINFVYWLTTDTSNPDMQTGEVVGYTSMFLSLLTIFLAIKEFRDGQNDGVISFKQAFRIGLFVSMIAAGIFTLFDTLYITIINPDFYEQYKAHSTKQMEEAGMSPTEISEQLAMFDSMQGPVGTLINGVTMFVTVLLLGLLISLIASAIMKRPNLAPKQ